MRKSTIVVVMLATTVASAEAAPRTERLSRGTTTETKSEARQKMTVRRAAMSQPSINHMVPAPIARDAAPAPMGAAAFTSARNAPRTEAPAPVAEARRVLAPPKAMRRRHHPVHAAGLRTIGRAAARRYVAKSELVSLEREVLVGADPKAAAPGAIPSAAAGAIQAMVTAEARKAGVSPALAHAVVKVESRYQPRATGKGGYVGLMQLSYQTARGMGFRGSRAALYEPSNNLAYGMRYLAEAVRLSGGNTCAAVSKYQGGHGVRGVTRAGAVYCAKVRRFMAEGVPAARTVAAN